jgi:F-type H+-transporting ATPase subunit b
VTFDLFTLAAQIVNFVILLVLLRIFLYQPVRRAMHERERRIAEMRDSASQARDEAQREKERLQQARDAWERERHDRERALEQELADRRERRLEDLEEEVANARAAMADALERDRDETLARLRGRSLELLEAELRRALADLADASLERQALVAFRDRLRDLPDDQRTALREAASGGPVVVATSFELDDDARDLLASAVRALVGNEAEVETRRDAELGFGVALRLGGVRVAWSADAYADDFADAQAAVLTRAADDLRGAAARDGGADADDD